MLLFFTVISIEVEFISPLLLGYKCYLSNFSKNLVPNNGDFPYF